MAAFTVSAYALVAAAPTVSVTFTVNMAVPAAVGAPLMTPAALKFSPAGSAPAPIDQANGPVPPETANVCEYAAPKTAFGSGEAVVIDGAELIVNVNAFVGAAPAASVALTVKFDVPAVVGVPLSTPAALIFKPAGRAPALTDHVNGAVPPETAKFFK